MGYQMIDGIDRLKKSLSVIATAEAGEIDLSSPQAISQIVKRGQANKFFDVGDQVTPRWAQDASHTYDLDMDVVAFYDVETRDGETKPGMWLQSHWGLPGVQFDASEAIYVASAEIAAGTTLHFTIGTTWGSNCVKDKVYQFTLENALPAGGQIVIGSSTSFYTWGAPDVVPSKWRAYTFAGPKYVTPIDEMVLTEGTEGTDLGTLASNTVYGTTGMNNLQRAAYGYNRWSQSGIRQWLNSEAAVATVDANGKLVGGWWEPQNPYDRPPQQITTLRGFMAGLPAEFLAEIQLIKVVTALNTVTDSAFGTTEITYDKFFLPSLEQEYVVPQLSGVEGAYWPYWKERLELNSPQAQGGGGTNPRHIRYAIENHSSAQYCRLRSANRGTAYHTWYVNTTGGVYYGTYAATNAYRPVPACVIC